jgi:MFS family permease
VAVHLPPAFRHRDFSLYWTGAVLSQIGNQFTVVAMAWQIYDLTDSPLQIGLLGLGRALPQIALALVGGVLADAFDRRRLLMLTQLIQLAIGVALTVLTLADAITPGILLASAVLLSFGAALENPPRQAIVPSLVPTADLSSAVALYTTQRSIGLIAGPSLAGIVLAVSGPGMCYLLDSVSWVVMLMALVLMRALSDRHRAVTMSMKSMLEGAKFVVRQPVIFPFMLLDFGATFFGAPAALFPILARDVFEVGEFGLGLMYAAPAAGAIATGVVMSSMPQVKETGKWVILGVLFFGICLVFFAIVPFFWLSLLLLAGTGAGNAVSGVLRSTANQMLTPDHLRGRMSAINSAFVMGGPQLGQFRSGAVADLWGAQAAGALGGLGAAACAIAVGMLPVIWRFRLGEEEPAVVEAPAAAGTEAARTGTGAPRVRR